ncbi:Na+/H+ antiporter NhaC family protein [Sinanaerobacter sp. ZZT-01]|uniref:Na+/H+ antiporter NhaC family protein n=1 Tax=Sinanaerobacter sp. ZZT-01 TaxID=3111540 RepID=UPI002D78F5EE|nr:Na+/H+ antiporter NhaC family protein [Sinanaerobacter sp. ZZT-01]WRR94349.1 Na+/H+ antiporter NhaC family protein [Sinanaerobacter sp. ZZT-01]
MKALIKFLPVIVLAALMICGFDALLAAPIATIAAILIAMLTDKLKFQDCIDAAMESVSKILVALFILMFAYAMASSFMSTGVGASIVNVALSLGVTARTVAMVGLIVTAILSVATGTSWGTFAACAPIFLWLNHIVGGDLYLTTAAIAGGACFGDNIGLISDTTVVSSGIQGVEVIDRIRHQGVWSIGSLVVAAAITFVIGLTLGLPNESTNAGAVISQIPDEVWTALAEKRPAAVDLLNQVQAGVPVYMIIPLILVIVTAILGFSTFLCLGTGLLSAYVLGLFAGTVTSTMDYLKMIMDGFGEAGSWVIVMMMWVAAFGGIMRKIAAFAPLSRLVSAISHNVRQLMFCNSVLSLLGNACLADEMAQIVTVGPIIKDLVDENVVAETEEDMYKLKLRNATFSDALGVFGSQLIPWHVYMGFYLGIASAVYPLQEIAAFDIIKYNVMAMTAVLSIMILTLTGWDRFVPLFRLPREPQVQLKKKMKQGMAER